MEQRCHIRRHLEVKKYKSVIPEKAYNALLAYEFDMSNDRNLIAA